MTARFHPGHHAAVTPDKPAIVMSDGSGSLTYAELEAMANRISRLFRSIGLGPGDHVALVVTNRLEFLPVVWGARYAGLYYTAISTRLMPHEVAHIVDDCGAAALVVDAALPELAADLAEHLPDRLEHHWVVGGEAPGYQPLEDAIADRSAEPLDDRPTGSDMLYSSGTTGRPKGVKPPLPGHPIGAEPSTLTKLVVRLFGSDADSVYLSPAPLYHAAPMRYCIAHHELGGTVVVMPRFDPTEALAAIEHHRVTIAQWVPTMFVRMLKLPPDEAERHDLSSLRVAVHAAAPCPIEVKRRMLDWWGAIIHEYYAGTEGNGFVYASPDDWLAHPGTVGRAVLGTVHIVDDDGRELGPGETGTVYFSDGPRFRYHGDEAKTADAHLPNGWSTLGDIGHLDADGFLHLTDRRAHTIIVGGVNVYPQEAENVLTLHPKVADVAVIGVPDPERGEQVKAIVQPTSMDEAGPDLEAELIAYCRERLSGLKCPRSVAFRDELPRHPTGKLFKRLLVAEYRGG